MSVNAVKFAPAHMGALRCLLGALFPCSLMVVIFASVGNRKALDAGGEKLWSLYLEESGRDWRGPMTRISGAIIAGSYRVQQAVPP